MCYDNPAVAMTEMKRGVTVQLVPIMPHIKYKITIYQLGNFFTKINRFNQCLRNRNWSIDCCLTPRRQYFSHIVAKKSDI